MIDWQSVVSNAFWIFGLAVILAGLSYYYWLSEQLGRPLGEVLSKPPFLIVVMGGLLLVGIGLTLTADSLWQTIPAAALIVASLAGLLALIRSRRSV